MYGTAYYGQIFSITTSTLKCRSLRFLGAKLVNSQVSYKIQIIHVFDVYKLEISAIFFIHMQLKPPLIEV